MALCTSCDADPYRSPITIRGFSVISHVLINRSAMCVSLSRNAGLQADLATAQGAAATAATQETAELRTALAQARHAAAELSQQVIAISVSKLSNL